MEEQLIKFSNVSRKYGSGESETYAIRDVNFTINAGEFVVILGQSGAGKSTVLNLLGGMDAPSEGEIIIDGIKLNSLKEKELSEYRAEKVGFIFQFYNLLTGLTALENVSINQEIVKKKKTIEPKKMLEKVGLKNKANSFPGQMSGGEQQRVSIARALSKNPAIILGDEPTGALDSETGKEIMKLMHDMCKDENRTLILVTHNSELARCADKVIKMKNGRISQIDCNENPVPVEGIEW